jgi:hypothetical protein
MAYDSLIAKAFAAHATTPAMTESGSSAQTRTLRDLDVDEPSPVRSPSVILSPEEGLEPVWDAVRQFKAKALAAMPSKVKSLEGVELVEYQSESVAAAAAAAALLEVPKEDQKKLKRKARYVCAFISGGCRHRAFLSPLAARY